MCLCLCLCITSLKKQGQQYWQQERRVCAELAQLRPGHAVNLTLADVLATHELKSFDYRVSTCVQATGRVRTPG